MREDVTSIVNKMTLLGIGGRLFKMFKKLVVSWSRLGIERSAVVIKYLIIYLFWRKGH